MNLATINFGDITALKIVVSIFYCPSYVKKCRSNNNHQRKHKCFSQDSCEALIAAIQYELLHRKLKIKDVMTEYVSSTLHLRDHLKLCMYV